MKGNFIFTSVTCNIIGAGTGSAGPAKAEPLSVEADT